MKRRLTTLLAAALAAALVLAACGSDDPPPAAEAPPAPEAPSEPGDDTDDTDETPDGPPYFTGPSIPVLDIIYERERFPQLMLTLNNQDRLWPEIFDEVNVIYSDDPIAPLVGGAAWIALGEPAIVWPAIEQGAIDAVIVAISADKEAWYLFGSPDVATPEDLVGARFSAGVPGDSWNIVSRIIMTDFWGIDPDDLQWLSVPSADGRLDAMLAGELDAFNGQPRHVPGVEEAGGHVLFGEFVENAQLQFIVPRQIWEDHRDAVCAALEGQMETVTWLFDYEEERGAEKVPDLIRVHEEFGFDSAGVEEAWLSTYPHTTSRDMGATPDALDRQMEIHKGAEDPVISQDFDWRDHADFSCLWELQELYGHPLRPDPSSL